MRFISNHFVLYLRLIKLNAITFIRILKLALARLMNIRKASNSVQLPTLPATLGPITHLNLWNFKDVLRFFKQRFSHQRLDDLENRWISISKSNLTNVPVQSVVSANLVFHVHYLEIAIEMIDFLIQSNVVFKNVVITCTDDNLRPLLQRAAGNIAQHEIEVITVENSYRDARPFLIALHRMRDNLPILKIHTKKSPHLSEAEGIAWRQSLLKGLVPDAIHVGRFTSWLKSENVPMVICPKEWLAERKHWGHNDIHVYSICKSLGITMVRKAPFPMGTMFWANKELVDELKKIPVPEPQDIRESHWLDSTWAHGFERAIGQVVANSGKGIALI